MSYFFISVRLTWRPDGRKMENAPGSWGFATISFSLTLSGYLLMIVTAILARAAHTLSCWHFLTPSSPFQINTFIDKKPSASPCQQAQSCTGVVFHAIFRINWPIRYLEVGFGLELNRTEWGGGGNQVILPIPPPTLDPAPTFSRQSRQLGFWLWKLLGFGKPKPTSWW